MSAGSGVSSRLSTTLRWVALVALVALACACCFAQPAKAEAAQAGWAQGADGSWTYAGESGENVIGWLYDGGSWYYLDEPDGKMAEGWRCVDDAWYYLKSGSGIMAADEWVPWGDSWYYLKGSGIMMTDEWMPWGNDWYYFKDGGEMAVDWQLWRDNWYYFGDSGAMQTGWAYWGGNWYYLNDSGAMAAAEWVWWGNAWYYLDSSGKMVTGWLSWEDNWYYLKDSGVMMADDWLQWGSAWYYLQSSGVMKTGWLYWGNAWYYLQDSGKMATGSKTIDGVAYVFKSSGVLQSPSFPRRTAAEGAAPGVSQAGALHVDGTQLVDEKGNVVQLKGLSTHGLAWFPQYVNDAFFNEMRAEWGCNVVRLAMYTSEYGGYCSGGSQSSLRALVEKGVQYAIDNDMYVIIDWHILSDGDPRTNQAAAKSFFSYMSEKYADTPNVIYEICNEPNGSTSWANIKQYANNVIPVIRANAPNAVVVVGTPTWSQGVEQAAASPLGYSNVMYSLHFYAATHKQDLRSSMERAYAKGLPMFVTEFGICDASGSGSIDEDQANAWINDLDSLGISYVMWNISNKSETSSIFNASCNKSSGFTNSDLSSSGKWFLRMMNGQLPAVNPSGGSDSGGSSSGSDAGSGSQQGGASASPYEPAANAVTVSATAKVSNSWESNGVRYCQYDITVTNNTDSACSAWVAEVDLGYACEVSQCWCAGVSADGTKLLVSSEGYNGELAAGETKTGIGAIVIG